MLNIDRVREDTPGCTNVLHFNNAGASLMPRPVIEAMTRHIQLESEIGGYEAADRISDELDGVYVSVAGMLGCKPNEVAIVENATRGWDMAFYSLKFNPGDQIITGTSEYASNYIAFLQIARRFGAVIIVVPNDESGQISLKALEESLNDRTKLIAITHVPTNGGLVNPAEKIGRIARARGILYLLDACQSLGQMPVRPIEIGCHILTGTARKFLRGPRGMGLMYVDQDTLLNLEPPFLDLHSAKWVSRDGFEIRKDAKRFENWECNIAGKIGLKAAVDYAQSIGFDSIWNRVSLLAKKLREMLNLIEGVRTHDLGEIRCGIVTFTVDRVSSEEIRDRLREKRINVSVSLLEYARLDLESRRLPALVRASIHYYNTEKEIEVFCRVIDETFRSKK